MNTIGFKYIHVRMISFVKATNARTYYCGTRLPNGSKGKTHVVDRLIVGIFERYWQRNCN